ARSTLNTTAVTVTPPTNGVLTQAQLDSIVAAAIQRWSSSGITPAQLAMLQSAQFQVTDLPNLTLGSTSPGHVKIDIDGAGEGWFIDPTPLVDEEFGTMLATTRLLATQEEAGNKADLLSTVMHEMGLV